MHAITWESANDVRYVEKPRPCITDPKDVILRITATSICGSDLHLFNGSMPGMKPGDILGHEFMGVVEEVGPMVKNIKKDQRVVASFDIACGECQFCMRKEFSACCVSNPSNMQEPMYGTRTSAIFGYSHLTGGISGGQAEFVRVPYADTNCLPIPDELPDIKALFLSDIIPTSYHGTELGNVGQGDTVAIWGLGPVGLLTALWCKVRGAGRIFGIDNVPERLSIARDKLGIEVIDFSKEKPSKSLLAKFPYGVDVVIECAGFEYAKSLKHKIELMLKLETDSSDIFEEMFQSVRCFGRVAVIGVYAGYANHFPVGAMMEKDLTVRCGQCPVQRYWKMNMEKLISGEFDPAVVVTTKGTLSEAPELYKKFQDRKEGTVKVFLRPDNCPDSLKH